MKISLHIDQIVPYSPNSHYFTDLVKDMKRRRYLATSCLGVVSASSGCAALTGLRTSLPDGMTIDTHHSVRPEALKDGVAPEVQSVDQTPVIYETLLTDGETAFDRANTDSSAYDFIRNTDFERSYIAVVEYFGTSSSRWLELRSIERGETDVHVVAEVKTPRSGTSDDLAMHSLVVRITEEDRERPSEISAEIVSCGLIQCNTPD